MLVGIKRSKEKKRDKASLKELLSYFQHLYPQEIDLTLTRIRQVLAVLGSPHRCLPPTIHVAGTNGKGSTISYLRAIYEAAGLHVHVYTSPHLIHYNERIRLAGKLITDRELGCYLNQVKEARVQGELTFFEALTAAAFLAFSKKKADVLLLETGLGGRLDATNVIENPLACVLTSLSLDHQDYLGNTLQAIAKEKAEIIKNKTLVFMTEPLPEIYQIFIDKARQTHSSLYKVSRVKPLENKEIFQLEAGEKKYCLPLPSLTGKHQLQNAALAAAVALGLKERLPVCETTVVQGIKTAYWPGRLQHLMKGPLYREGREIWLDGAHNEEGFQALGEFIFTSQQKERKIILMGVAMLKNRDPKLFFHLLSPLVDQFLFLIMSDKERFHSPEELACYTQKPWQVVKINRLNEFFQKRYLFGARIFISGSLYLVGKVLDLNKELIV